MRRPILLFLFVQISIILFLYYLSPSGLEILRLKSSQLKDREGLVVSVTGTVTNVSVKEFYTALTVKTDTEKVYVHLSSTEDEARLYSLNGKTVSLTGKISLPAKRRNPGCFDYSLYLKSKGIYTIMEVSKYRISEGPIKRPLSNLLYLLKGSFYTKIRPFLSDDNFSVLAGLLFGDKSYMEDELYEQYQQTGIAHILAVSGLHVSLVYSLIEKLTKGQKTIKSSLLTVFLLYCYAVLSGFSVSVLRASLMICLRITAFHIKRPYDSLCAASAAASLLLLANPYILFDSGFQLSFAAAFTIATALPFIKSKLKFYAKEKRIMVLDKAALSLSSGIAIGLGMAPLIAFHFTNYSLISFFINPIAIGLAGIILPLGLAAFGLSFVFSGFVMDLFVSPAALFIRILSFINSLGKSLGLSGSCKAPPLHLLFFYYILFFWFFSETRVVFNRKSKERTLFVIALAIMIFGITVPKGYETHSVTFVDVGQGDCIHLNIEGCNILIDGGGSYYKNVGKDTLKDYLLKNGIDHIDYAVITHNDLDHSKGIAELKECFDIRKVVNAGNDNDDCAIIGCETDGIKYLFTSDATKAREEKLIRLYPNLKADIIKLGHHGSKTSTSQRYLDYVDPSFALISCGLNNKYGHPSKELVEELEKTGIIYGRTDLCGAIYIKDVRNGIVTLENAAKDKTWHITIQK